MSRFAGRRARYNAAMVAAVMPFAVADFSAMTAGAGGALPAGFTYTCASAVQRVQTSASTCSAANVAVNTVAIGSDGNGNGIVLENGYTFGLITPAAMAWFDANGAVVSITLGQSAPDGSTTGVRWDWAAPSSVYTAGKQCFTTAVTEPRVSMSLFLLHNNATYADMGNAYTPGTPPVQDAALPTWTRFDLPSVATSGNAGMQIGGDPAGAAMSLLVWSGNIARGTAFPVEPTGNSSAATSSPRLLNSSVSTYVTGGAPSWVVRLQPKGRSTEYGGGLITLASWSIDSFVQLDTSANTLILSSGGVVATFSLKGVFFNRLPLEIYFSFGLGASRALYRNDGGPLVDMGSGPALPPLAGGLTTTFHNRASDGSAYFDCRLQRIEAYLPGQIPARFLTPGAASSTFEPPDELKPIVGVHGNSRTAGSTYSIVQPSQVATGHLPRGWIAVNVGHSGYVTSGDPVHPGTNLLDLAAGDIDSALTTANMRRYMRLLIYNEIVNGIKAFGHTAADEWARIQAYLTARVAAGWNALMIELTPLADNARFPAYGAFNSVYAATNALIRAQAFAWAATLVQPNGIVGVPIDLIDNENDPFMDMTDPTKSSDGVHYTDLTYVHRNARYAPRVVAMQTVNFFR